MKEMKTKHIATIYAILAAALYAINIPMSKLLLNHAGATVTAAFGSSQDKRLLFDCTILGCCVQHDIIAGETCNTILYCTSNHGSKYSSYGKRYDRH